MMWSTHSRRIDPISRSAKPFSQGEAGAVQGIPLMEQGLALFLAGRRVTRPYMLAVLASAKADLGKPGEGLEARAFGVNSITLKSKH
jgi:hypothetical protein